MTSVALVARSLREPTLLNRAEAFMDFPREIRDQVSCFCVFWSVSQETVLTISQIYRELLVAYIEPIDKTRFEALKLIPRVQFCSSVYSRHVLRSQVEQLLRGKSTFNPLKAASGFIRSSKQVHAEAMSIFWSDNHFLTLIDGTSRNVRLGQIFEVYVKPAELAQLRHLRVVVHDTTSFTQDNCDTEVRSLKREMVNVVKTIGIYCHHLRHLSVYYSSAYFGEVRVYCPDIDALLTHAGASYFMLQRVIDNIHDGVTRNNFRRLFANQYNLSDALCTILRHIEHFEIDGDLPSAIIDRIETHFRSNPQCN